tara:strand:- start:27 stop:653 length:627 start_codon:yes stop_codon:yes gene_type:complete
MGLPAAEVKIEVSDTIFLGAPAKIIKYNTHTISFIHSFFAVDNEYKTITSPDYKKILSFSKETHHPGLDDTLSAILNINTNLLEYVHTSKKINSEIFNVFSLFHYLQDTTSKIESKLSNLVIDKEGSLFKGHLSLESENSREKIVDLNLHKLNEPTPINRKTDIFTWAVFLENSKRKLIFNKRTGVLEKCIFSKGIISMKAKLTSYTP